MSIVEGIYDVGEYDHAQYDTVINGGSGSLVLLATAHGNFNIFGSSLNSLYDSGEYDESDYELNNVTITATASGHVTTTASGIISILGINTNGYDVIYLNTTYGGGSGSITLVASNPTFTGYVPNIGNNPAVGNISLLATNTFSTVTGSGSGSISFSADPNSTGQGSGSISFTAGIYIPQFDSGSTFDSGSSFDDYILISTGSISITASVNQADVVVSLNQVPASGSITLIATAIGGVVGTGSATLAISVLGSGSPKIISTASASLGFSGVLTEGLVSELIATSNAIISRNYSDVAYPTQLSNNIDAFTQSIPVQYSSGFPVPCCITVGRGLANQEVMFVLSIVNNNTLYVTRGFNSQPFAHAINETVEHDTNALDYQEANYHHTVTTRLDHQQYMQTSGIGHNEFDRHFIGISLQAGLPSFSMPGDEASEGVSTLVAAADHVHGRETQSQLSSDYFPIGFIAYFPSVTTSIQTLEEIASMSPYGNATVSNVVLQPATYPGWLKCDLSSYSTTTYPQLFAEIGYANGGSGAFFCVPGAQSGQLVATNTIAALNGDSSGIAPYIKCDLI